MIFSAKLITQWVRISGVFCAHSFERHFLDNFEQKRLNFYISEIHRYYYNGSRIERYYAALYYRNFVESDNSTHLHTHICIIYIYSDDCWLFLHKIEHTGVQYV